MSGQTMIPNYRETLFDYPDLTPIHGVPSYDTLKLMTNQLKANARNVRTPLGGGLHGYLGLLLTGQQYSILSPTPFIRPAHPGPLVIPAFQLQHIVTAIQSQHNEAVRLFNEVNNVEQALRQQLVKAVDESYLIALHNRQTNTIIVPINQILQFLFSIHGKVSAAKLMDAELLVRQTVFHPTHPIDVIFNKVEDLLDLSIAAQADYTSQQLINIAYVIINKTGKFSNDIREWNKLPLRTWANFKNHFRIAQDELREVGDLELRDTPYHSTNMIQEVLDGVQQALGASPDDQLPPPMIHEANAATQNQMMPQMMHQMMQMMRQMQAVQLNLTNNSNGGNDSSNNVANNNNNNSQRRNNTNGRSRGRLNTSKYCWSHGACAHDSSTCRDQKEGHKAEATFSNKMGGSTAYCNN